MIPNHAQFLAAIQEKQKVRVRYYSIADSGVFDRVCAPMDYGPGRENTDGLNRYWHWDYASKTGLHAWGLLPQQIVDLQMLGEGFDPAPFSSEPPTVPVSVASSMRPTAVVTSGEAISSPP